MQIPLELQQATSLLYTRPKAYVLFFLQHGTIHNPILF